MVGGWFRRKRTDTGSVEAVSLENEAVTVEAPADSLLIP